MPRRNATAVTSLSTQVVVCTPTASSSQAQPLEPSQVDALCQPVDNLHLTSTQAMKDWNKTVIANVKRMSVDKEYRQEVSKKLS